LWHNFEKTIDIQMFTEVRSVGKWLSVLLQLTVNVHVLQSCATTIITSIWQRGTGQNFRPVQKLMQEV
jgi:hypothetical protein